MIPVRKFLLQALRALNRGKEPPHIIRTPEQNDLSHIACVVAKLDAALEPKKALETFFAEQKSNRP